MSGKLIVGNLSANIGGKVQGLIRIPKAEFSMPLTLINGAKAGKTILITAGVHGCEYPGIKAVIELAKEIDADQVNGQLIMVHLANIQGFVERKAAVVPEDGKNLLRVFPGNQEGTLSEKIAFFMTTEMICQSDYYFDIHGGDLHEDLIPHLYYPGAAAKDVIDASIELAKLFDVPYYIRSSMTNGTYTSAAMSGIPSLLIERGSCGVCPEEIVLNYKQDLLNVLSMMGIVDSNMTPKKCHSIEVKDVIYLEALTEGCWTCFVKAGQVIKTGDKLGEVTDYFGNIIDYYYAQFDAVVLYHTVAYSVTKGSSLIAYGKKDL